MGVSQQEIAASLGISPSMVSHALRGDQRVAESTRLRVIEAAERLGYTSTSNHEARSLIAKRYGKRVLTDIIAVISETAISDGVFVPHLPYFAPFIRGIELAAAERGWDVYLCSAHDGKLPKLVERGGVDGVICIGTPPEGLREVDVPVINSGRRGKGWVGDLGPDHGAGAALAVEHLLQLGHRKIGYLCFSVEALGREPNPVAVGRLAAYRRTLEEAGIEVDERLVVSTIFSPSRSAGSQAMRELLDRGVEFTSLLGYNDLVAMGAIDVLQEVGFQVPRDVSVVGFDDISREYGFVPPVTSIAFDHAAIGRRAVEAIGQYRERAGTGSTYSNETFPVELIPRDSSGPVSQ